MERLRLPARRAWILMAAIAALAAAFPDSAAAQPPLNPGQIPSSFCGAAGQTCCQQPRDSSGTRLGPPFCKAGLGCDIAANRCVSPCGGDGQVCCDGPDTYAPNAGASPTSPLYCPDGPASCVTRKPMCSAGACSVTTHQCRTCGQVEGDFCCPPDAQSAVASCRIAGTFCSFHNDSLFSGTCVACGKAGQPPCPDHGGSCEPGLRPGASVCEPCGKLGQQTCLDGCTEGAPSIPLLVEPGPMPPRMCVACGLLGQPPCQGNVCREGQAFSGVCATSAACAAYALDAARANLKNESTRCGLVGARWVSDVGHHVRGCRFEGPPWRDQETTARTRLLARCDDCKEYAQLLGSCRLMKGQTGRFYMEDFTACVEQSPASIAEELVRRRGHNPCGPSPVPTPTSPPTPNAGNGCCWRCLSNGGFPLGGTDCRWVYGCTSLPCP
jgi:hypothetical protein